MRIDGAVKDELEEDSFYIKGPVGRCVTEASLRMAFRRREVLLCRDKLE